MIRYNVEKLNFSGWPVADDYLVEVGRIALVWAGLEDFLYTCVGKLASYEELSDPRILTVFSHADFDSNLALLDKLCVQLLPEHPNLGPYPEVITILRSARRTKDVYLHGKMAPNPGTGVVEIEEADSVGGRLKRR